jgi:antitoxin component YwqK of YwqJK toxin-antitoxin module
MRTKIKYQILIITLILIGCKENEKEITYYINGEIKSEVIKTVVDSDKIVDVKKFYETGGLFEQYRIINGYKQGLHYVYYENGNIKVIQTHKDGKKNGVVKEFDKNGIIKVSATYRNNKMNGISKSFNSNGDKQQSFLYLNGSQLIYNQYYVDKEHTGEKIVSCIVDSNHIANAQGQLIFDYKTKGYIEEKSFLYKVFSSNDTLIKDKKHEVNIRFINDQDYSLELQLADMDSTLTFVSPPNIIKSENKELSFDIIPDNLGDYLLLGKLLIKSKEDNEEYEQIFYHQFYVVE